jgi:hypothetical protein
LKLQRCSRSQGARRRGGWCPDHKPCNFVKGKPRTIISLLISENAIKYYVISIVALSYRYWMKTLAALISNPCPDIITMNPI